jgi:hypothetical protein
MLDEQERIQHNLKIIREYLLREFPGFYVRFGLNSIRITEDNQCGYQTSRVMRCADLLWSPEDLWRDLAFHRHHRITSFESIGSRVALL